MPLTLLITSILGLKERPKGAAAYCVGIVGNSRIRAVPHYGETGFEVLWQVVPDNPSDHAGPERATQA